MIKTLERAFAEVALLPEAAQEKIGRDLLTYLDKLHALRATLDDSIARGGNFTEDDADAEVKARLDLWERQRASE